MTWYTLLPLVTAVSVGMRLLPFLIGPFLRKFAFLHKLSVMLPICLMTMIAAYTLKEVPFTAPPYGIPEIIGIASVLLAQYLFRTVVISMGIGMVMHQLLLSFTSV